MSKKKITLEEAEKYQTDYIIASINYYRFEDEIRELNEMKKEQIRKNNFGSFFNLIKPLFDAGINLRFDERLEGYYFPNEGLYYRMDGNLYNKGFFINNSYTVEELVNKYLKPKQCSCTKGESK